VNRFRTLYGAGPGHLLLMLACFAVAAYAATRAVVADPSAALRTALWFGGAVLVHDLVLFPLYALADRGLIALARRARGQVSVLGHLRVPLALSGLLLLVFLPTISRHSASAYRHASGLDQEPYLVRWLLLSALFVLVSGGCYLARRWRIARRPA
jgi:hypothetical protein